MPAKFDLNDSSVVVIIGSGAGGGTLANELAKKGISVVVLEAGRRMEMTEFQNDEIGMFGAFTWFDPRTSSGSWYVAKIVSGFALVDLQARRRHDRPLGRVALRFQEHEFKTRTRYGAIAGANLIDWPLDLKEMEPYYERAEMRMGVTGTHGIPRLPASNHVQGSLCRREKMGYTKYWTTNMAINPVPRDGRAGCQQTGFCVQGCTFGAKWSTLYVDIPQAEATGKCEVRAESQVLRIEHDARGKVTGVVYADAAGSAAAAEGAHRLRRREFDREPAPAAEFVFEQCSRRASRTPPGRSDATTCATPRPPSSPPSKSPCTCIAARRMAGIVMDEAGLDTKARIRRRLQPRNCCRRDCPASPRT